MIESIGKLRESSHLDDSKWTLETGEVIHVYGSEPNDPNAVNWGEQWRKIADEIEAEIAERYMLLPVDADGAPIRPDDLMACKEFDANDFDVKEYVLAVSYDCWVDKEGLTYIPCNTRHAKPRTLEDMMTEYEELAANQNVKDYFEVSKKLRKIQSEQFMDEPELELYKEVNGYRFYIELPYDELWIMTDKVEVKHHSYSYRYERPNGSTVMSCSSLCGYSREWAIKRLDEEIDEIRELMEVRDD